MKLSVSAVLGHNASEWLSTVMNCPGKGHTAHHQLKAKLFPHRRWWNAFNYEIEHGITAPGTFRYWEFIRGELEKYDTLDCNSWVAYVIPQLEEVIDLRYIVYVPRNGLEWVHSVTTTSSYVEFMGKPKHFAMDKYLAQYWKALGRPHKAWRKFSSWERVCFYWSTCYHMPIWLESRIETPILIYRMEDLTRKISSLQQLANKLITKHRVPKNYLANFQAKDINRHVVEKLAPIKIWRQWSRSQRDAFRRICGEGMEHYGYEIY